MPFRSKAYLVACRTSLPTGFPGQTLTAKAKPSVSKASKGLRVRQNHRERSEVPRRRDSGWIGQLTRSTLRRRTVLGARTLLGAPGVVVGSGGRRCDDGGTPAGRLKDPPGLGEGLVGSWLLGLVICSF